MDEGNFIFVIRLIEKKISVNIGFVITVRVIAGNRLRFRGNPIVRHCEPIYRRGNLLVF